MGNRLVGGVKFMAKFLPTILTARREFEMALHRRLQDAQRRFRRGEIDAAEFAQIQQQVTISSFVLRKDD